MDSPLIARRSLLKLSGGALAAAGASAAAAQPQPAPLAPAPAPSPPPSPPSPPRPADWARVRAQFALLPDRVDMSAMLIASHPRPVREAVERHRRALDEQPIEYLEQHNRRLQNLARERVGAYMGLPPGDVALTDSTTMGAGLVYHGLRLRPGQEVLTTHHDYYVTHESLRLASERSGATVRRVALYDDLALVSPDQLAATITGAIGPATRVLALTWVHSSTGLKLPLAQIAQRVRAINAGRAEDDEVLICVDGVHGFGNQDSGFAELGCDFFFAGCHKWLFGPRGTGVVLGGRAGWAAMRPTIPTFLDTGAYAHWISGEAPGECTGARLSPGGFKAFEHVWALADAFWLHDWVGRAQVAQRTAELADQLKAGLAGMPHVTLVTPRSHELSAGIVSFDVAGMSSAQAVARLREWRVLGSIAPYARPHVRLTPSIRNSPQEVDFALSAVRALA